MVNDGIEVTITAALIEGGGARMRDKRRAPADRTAFVAPRNRSAELSIAGESA